MSHGALFDLILRFLEWKEVKLRNPLFWTTVFVSPYGGLCQNVKDLDGLKLNTAHPIGQATDTDTLNSMRPLAPLLSMSLRQIQVTVRLYYCGHKGT